MALEWRSLTGALFVTPSPYIPLGMITVSKSLVRLPWAASGRDVSADITAVAPRLNPRQLFGQEVPGRDGSPPSMLSLQVSPDQWSREVVSSELSAPTCQCTRDNTAI